MVRSVPGAKLFADAEHPTHPEWVGVFSGFIRSAKRVSGYGDDAEVFEPNVAYGLDDDLQNLTDEDYRRGIFNETLLSWRHGDENPTDAHRLGGRTPDGHTSVPSRLWHLLRWITQWLGWMYIFKRDEDDGLTKQEMRRVLREMSDDTRNQFIWWLGKVGQGNDEGWETLVAPFLNEAWPRERIYRTASSVESWISMLDDTGTSFPVVYASVKRYLVPVETERHPFYRFTREVGEDEPITTQFPEETLDLLDSVTPKVLSRTPYELSKILVLLSEAAPDLRADHRYLRLMDLVERM